jgi:3-hydroxyacyl-CoA dehydrogenase
LYDVADDVVRQTLEALPPRFRELHEAGLCADPDACIGRIRAAASLAETVGEAEYVQENALEQLDVKQRLFADLDRLSRRDAILASSTSAIPASRFTESLPGRGRCLVAHPANPPYLIPVVELCGAPWTEPATLDRAAAFLKNAGMEPIRVQREVRGFILNRLQGALLGEAFRLVEEGYVSPDDLDKVISCGLGLRWSFMGPFETIDLNAPGGLRDYCARYGAFYQELRSQPPSSEPWSEQLLDQLERHRREALPMAEHAARQAWRDRRLTLLAAHKQQADNS